MSPKLRYSVLTLIVLTVSAQSPEVVPPCVVANAYDFEYGIANIEDCSVLDVQNSFALTATSFSAGSLTISNQNLTIQSSTSASDSETILDFGSYALTSKIFVTGHSAVTFTDISLQNYAPTSVQNGSTSTFMELFSFDSTSMMYSNNVHFLVDAGRCAQDSNYSSELAAPRTSWLQSLESQQFQGGQAANGTYYVQHAVAPITYTRVNLTTTVPQQATATITFANSSFSCPTIIEQSPYQVLARVWTPLELLSSLSLPDSRTILLQQSLATANGSWGTMPLLIAESRVVYIVGTSNATLAVQDEYASQLSNSSGSAAAPVEVLPDSLAAEPDSFLTWTIDDNTDLLQVGYLGSLTLQALVLKLPEPCCVQVSLPGSWYFSNQPLPWNIFGVILPGAFSVQAVQVPQLNAPAYLILKNVSIVYGSCDASFAGAAQLLIAKASADSEDDASNSVSFVNQTLICIACLFQGSEQVPSVYSNAVSQVELYDTNITCLDAGGANTTASAGSAQNSTSAGQTVATAGAAWAPPVWLPVLLAIVTSVIVGLGLTAVWRHVRTLREAAYFSNLREARFVQSQLTSRRSSAAAHAGYMQRSKSSGLQNSTQQVQKSKLSTVYTASQLS